MDRDQNSETGMRDTEMEDAVRLREKRREVGKKTGERPLWRNLSMVGSLGWLIVTPTVIGIFAGRWLDVRFGTGIFWSGALIMVGVGLGAFLAWQRMNADE